MKTQRQARWACGPILVTGWGSSRWVWEWGYWSHDLKTYFGKRKP